LWKNQEWGRTNGGFLHNEARKKETLSTWAIRLEALMQLAIEREFLPKHRKMGC